MEDILLFDHVFVYSAPIDSAGDITYVCKICGLKYYKSTVGKKSVVAMDESWSYVLDSYDNTLLTCNEVIIKTIIE